MRRTVRSLLVGSALTLPAAAHSATITGDVIRDGQAVRGALVTVFSQDSLVSETVFTDAEGRYRLGTMFVGHLRVRARAPRSADSSVSLEAPSPSTTLNHRFALKPLATQQEISDSLAPSAHFAQIKFPTLSQRTVITPSLVGAHDWQPMSYNAKAGLVYIPLIHAVSIFAPSPEAMALMHKNAGRIFSDQGVDAVVRPVTRDGESGAGRDELIATFRY
jgi:hypothetical protein